jgi:hypothetical protein
LRAEAFAGYKANLKALRASLVGAGIPEDAIAEDLAIGGRYRADLAVLDATTKRPIAFFEVRSRAEQSQVERAQTQLTTFAGALGNPGIPAYLAATVNGKLQLMRLPLGKKLDATELIPEPTPTYESLLTTAQVVLKADNRKEHHGTVAAFKWVCWAMALIVVAVLVLDYFELYTLNQDRLLLLGAAAALVVIPFTRKLKMLGVEFEALTAENVAQQPAPAGLVGPGTGRPKRGHVTEVIEDAKDAVGGTLGDLTGRRPRRP